MRRQTTGVSTHRAAPPAMVPLARASAAWARAAAAPADPGARGGLTPARVARGRAAWARAAPQPGAAPRAAVRGWGAATRGARRRAAAARGAAEPGATARADPAR